MDSSRVVGTSGLGPGTVLDGKYEILNRIGAGGMGEVFKARHLHLNAYRCIKVMKQELLADELFRSRFLREARLATQIHHSNIAVVHDFFVSETGNYMVTEFIDGRTVRQWAAAYGPFPLPLAADFASQVLAGLDHIHRRGLLHRDISPDNVMLAFDADDRCTAKIIDLGIAKDVGGGAAADKTQAGVLIGNPKYMSPEQLGLIGDGEQLDGRADLYCLGVVLYEMLLGVAPFVSETPHGYIMKHLTQTPRRFKEAKPNIDMPAEIEEVIFRALEKDRTKRYASAREFAAAIAPFLQAPAGSLSHEDVERLRGGLDATAIAPIPKIAPDDATVASIPDDTQAKLRAAEAEKAFQRAWEDGSPSAWREFLQTHGDSARAEEAQRLVEEAEAFDAAVRTESETAVRQFLIAWPDARHHLEAGILLAKLKQRAAEIRAFEDARARNTASAYRLYLTAYPSGARADDARERLKMLEEQAFTALLQAQDEKAARAFLSTYPDSPRRGEAEGIITRASNAALARREPADWEAAWENGTAAAWERYIAEHPQSPRIAEARSCRQESLDFALATTTNSAAMWRAFIKAWPSGRHRIDAEIRMQKIK